VCALSTGCAVFPREGFLFTIGEYVRLSQQRQPIKLPKRTRDSGEEIGQWSENTLQN
jgi:hypothetical protein